MGEAVHEPVEDRPSRPEPFGNRRDVGVQASKNETTVRLRAGEASEVMAGHIEGFPVPVGVRDRHQLARVGEGPTVVRTLKTGRGAVLERAQQRATVRTAIENGRDAGVFTTSHNYRAPSDPTSLEVV